MTTTTEGPDAHTNRLSVAVAGQAMSLFFVISFLLCVLFTIVLPTTQLQHWFTILPGVAPLTWTSGLLGVVEMAIYGWYIALVFVPLYNWAARRAGR